MPLISDLINEVAVVVIDKSGKYSKEEGAFDYLFRYTVFNDILPEIVSKRPAVHKGRGLDLTRSDRQRRTCPMK